MKLTRTPLLVYLTAALAALILPAAADAQVSRLGETFGLYAGGARGSDIAFDSKNNVYLAVSSFGTVLGRYISADGVPLGEAFVIESDINIISHFPRVAFSPDAAGGAGAFLVTWHTSVAGAVGTDVYSRIVSFTQGLGAETRVAVTNSFWEAGAAVAYATGSKEFLVVWQAVDANIRGARISNSGAVIAPVDVAVSGEGERDPNVTYNPQADEFFVVYSGYNASFAFVRGQRLKAGTGALIGAPTHLTASSGTYITDVSYSPATGKYLTSWFQPGGTFGRPVNADGSPAGDVRALSTRYTTYDALSLAFNRTSGTFFAVSQDGRTFENGGVEIDGHGTPLTTGVQTTLIGGSVGNFHPRVAAHSSRAEWVHTTAHDFAMTFAQRLKTDTRMGGAPPRAQADGARADFDGDGKQDVAVFRPSDGGWWVRGQFWAQWGTVGDVAVPGDYNGDGLTDVAVWRPSTGHWWVSNQFVVQWGAPGDVAVPGDYNGDGVTDVAVWRPSTGHWWVRNQFVFQWGAPGDVPVPGDYNGDGRTDIAVWRPSTGQWWVPNQFVVQWGAAGDVAVPGDYNGDGVTDVAVWRPSTGHWWVRNQFVFQWGATGDVPVPGDYNGDGRTDVAVWRPSTGDWWVPNQFTLQWGTAGDIPLARLPQK